MELKVLDLTKLPVNDLKESKPLNVQFFDTDGVTERALISPYGALKTLTVQLVFEARKGIAFEQDFEDVVDNGKRIRVIWRRTPYAEHISRGVFSIRKYEPDIRGGAYTLNLELKEEQYVAGANTNN